MLFSFWKVIQRFGNWWSSLSRSRGSIKGNGRGGKGRGGGYGYQSHSPSPFSTFSKAMEDAQSLTNMMRFAAALQPGQTPRNNTTASTVSPGGSWHDGSNQSRRPRSGSGVKCGRFCDSGFAYCTSWGYVRRPANVLAAKGVSGH